MNLKQHISEIREYLETGRYTSEASVSQGIVLRILQCLGWPTHETDIVCPEFTLEGRRVDYALCHPRRKPIVFIEVKRVGMGHGSERQLFEYAFHRGVPMAILCDGQEWHFYLPAERGEYQERRVYKLDLIARDVDESVERLTRYLSYDAICNESALRNARSDYRDVTRERSVSRTLPQAWQELVADRDDLLIELISEKVEDLTGYRPSLDAVADFVGELTLGTGATAMNPSAKSADNSNAAQSERSDSRSRSKVSFVYGGDRYEDHSAIKMIEQFLELLSSDDPTFIERFASSPDHGRKRRYVAQKREALYPGRPDLVSEYATRLTRGYWLGTNYSRNRIEKMFQLACRVAGIPFEKIQLSI